MELSGDFWRVYGGFKRPRYVPGVATTTVITDDAFRPSHTSHEARFGWIWPKTLPRQYGIVKRGTWIVTGMQNLCYDGTSFERTAFVIQVALDLIPSKNFKLKFSFFYDFGQKWNTTHKSCKTSNVQSDDPLRKKSFFSRLKITLFDRKIIKNYNHSNIVY